MRDLLGHVHVHVQSREGLVVRQAKPGSEISTLLHDRITKYPKLQGTHSWVMECLEVMRDPRTIPHLILVIPLFWFLCSYLCNTFSMCC